jgi:hypothetical protein
MPTNGLIELIDKHAEGLTQAAFKDLLMNPRTPAFRGVPREQAAARVTALYRNLARWLSDHDDDAVRAAHEDWGRTRFDQRIPISEIVYGVLVAKGHLRQYARDHGLAELQTLEATIGEFFDRALYYLVRGYEMRAATPPQSGRALPA